MHATEPVSETYHPEATAAAGSVRYVSVRVAITVLVTSRLSNPGLQVVVLSLCNETFVDFWIKSKELLAGNVLSIYAAGVKDRGPCASYLQHCSQLNVREHREIPKKLILQPEVKSFANCNACHTKAESGSYREREIRIPNYGRWED